MHKSINSNVQLTNLFVRTVYEWAAMENGEKKVRVFEIHVVHTMWMWCSVKIHSNSFFCETLSISMLAAGNSGRDGVVIATIRPGKHHEIKVFETNAFCGVREQRIIIISFFFFIFIIRGFLCGEDRKRILFVFIAIISFAIVTNFMYVVSTLWRF